MLTVLARAESKIHYGSNPAATKSFTHDGVKFYFEVYGTAEPLLIGRGRNSGSTPANLPDSFRE